MTYFPDLSPYTYSGGRSDRATLNVGWLSRAHAFPTAAPEAGLVEALNRCCFRGERWAMGIHPCDFCGERRAFARVNERKVRIGSGEIHVENAGVWYGAPTLVVHYVEAHSYLPPAPFRAAVLAAAARITILSNAEREALCEMPQSARRELACDAVERVVERSEHEWARAAFEAARAGRRDWDAAIPEQFEDGLLLDLLAALSGLMDDARIASDPELARHDFLEIAEGSRDT